MTFKLTIYTFLFLLLKTVTISAQPLPELIPYKGKNGWGYCDSNKVIKIKPQFENAHFFVDGRAFVEVKDSSGTYACIIDNQGNYIVPPAYHWTGRFYPSIKGATLNVHDGNGKWGLLNAENKLVIPFLYDGSGDFEKPSQWDTWFMITLKNGKYGVVDTNNNVLVPFEYSSVQPLDHNDNAQYWMVGKDSLVGLIDFNCNQVLPPTYQRIRIVSGENLFIVTQNNKTGVVNKAGEIVVPVNYDDVEWWGNQYLRGFATKKNGYWGWHNRKGKLVIEPQNLSSLEIYKQYIRARRDMGIETKSVLLNKRGKEVIPPIYNQIGVYDDSLVVTKYIDSGYAYLPHSRALNRRTLKPISEWREVEEYSPAPGPICGGSGHRYSYQDPPHLDSSGQRIYKFWKDGTLWNVHKYIPHGHPNKTPYYSIFGNWKGQVMYALVDSNKNFIISPQSMYSIANGNYHDNKLIVVRTNSTFALTDTLFNLIVGPSPREITGYFEWPAQTFAMADYEFFDLLRDEDNEGKQKCFRCNCTTILDSSGNIVKGFEPYCNPRFYTKGGYPYSPRDLIMVFDSLGKVGFLDINGHIQYPALSFQYSNIQFYEPNYFLCTNNYPLKTLVDSLGKEYIPATAIEDLTRAQAYNPYLNQRTDIPSLYQVRFQSSRLPPVYMDTKGTVYADPEALKE